MNLSHNLVSQLKLEPPTIFSNPEFSFVKKQDSQSYTILVIDDNDTLHQYLCENFKTTYRIVVVHNNQQGLEMAVIMSPDLIITGLALADVECESLCFKLKHNDKTSHIPILILSGQQTLCGRIKSFYLGADDCLTSPFLLIELQIRIQNLIQSRKLLQQKYQTPWELRNSSRYVESADKLFLQRAIEVVEEQIENKQFGSAMFAKEMGVSQRQLRRKLNLVAGTSANDFIRKIRLLRAAELLTKNVGNVSEVAYRVGFNNLSYFSKCFKTLYRYSPNEYAKRNTVTTFMQGMPCVLRYEA